MSNDSSHVTSAPHPASGGVGPERVRSVVVGIDDSATAAAAVDWAADAAARRGIPLVVAHGLDHVADAEAAVAPVANIPIESPAEARHLLDGAVTAARSRHPGLRVDVVQANSSAAHLLVELARGADVVVVGSRRPGIVTSVLLGSVSREVAGTAPCPVVVVNRVQEVGAVGPVVVDIGRTADLDPALEFAFAEAHSRGCELHAVRFWPRDEWPVDLPLKEAPFTEDWEGVAESAVADILTPHRARHPGVRTVIRVSRRQPEHKLVGASQSACLVVVGRHHDDGPHAAHLGRLAGRLLQHSWCPVAVVGSEVAVGGVSADRVVAGATH